MLDTLLKISSVLRDSPQKFKYHRYVNSVYPQKKSTPVYFNIPVNKDGGFDFTQKTLLEDENVILKLLFLNYKTYDNDGSKKYYFGDIYRYYSEKDKKVSGGNFKTNIDTKTDSYEATEGKHSLITDDFIDKFRESVGKYKKEIFDTLHANNDCFIHFDFSGKHWYELEKQWSVIEDNFVDKFFSNHNQNYVLTSYLHKTLRCNDDEMVDTKAKAYRNKIFTLDMAKSIFYGISFSERYFMLKGDLKLSVLPFCENITEYQLFEFSSGIYSKNKEEKIIEDINSNKELPSNSDELFSFLFSDEPEEKNITRQDITFDLIFSRKGGNTDTDILELSNIGYSQLYNINSRIDEIRLDIERKRNAEFEDKKRKYDESHATPMKVFDFKPMSIARSLENIVNDMGKDKKKYQSVILRTIPKIYQEAYYYDKMLLGRFNDCISSSLKTNPYIFNNLKWDLYFLLNILNNKENLLLEIENSKSYKIGKLLGELSRPLGRKINSFEPSYVAMIGSRVATFKDVIKHADFINQKLVMHKCMGFSKKSSLELTDIILGFDENYNKEECIFGFFKGYLDYKPSEETIDEDGTENE